MPVVDIKLPPVPASITEPALNDASSHGPIFWTGVGAGAAFLCVGGFFAVSMIQERRARHLRQGAEFLAFQRPARERKSRGRERSPDRSAGGVRIELNSIGMFLYCVLH